MPIKISGKSGVSSVVRAQVAAFFKYDENDLEVVVGAKSTHVSVPGGSTIVLPIPAHNVTSQSVASTLSASFSACTKTPASEHVCTYGSSAPEHVAQISDDQKDDEAWAVEASKTVFEYGVPIEQADSMYERVLPAVGSSTTDSTYRVIGRGPSLVLVARVIKTSGGSVKMSLKIQQRGDDEDAFKEAVAALSYACDPSHSIGGYYSTHVHLTMSPNTTIPRLRVVMGGIYAALLPYLDTKFPDVKVLLGES